MRERAQLAGGDLSVESAPGRGLRALGVDAERGAGGPGARSGRAVPDTLPTRSVPGYTWR